MCCRRRNSTSSGALSVDSTTAAHGTNSQIEYQVAVPTAPKVTFIELVPCAAVVESTLNAPELVEFLTHPSAKPSPAELLASKDALGMRLPVSPSALIKVGLPLAKK